MSTASEWASRMMAAKKEAQRILYEPRPCPYLFLYQATLHSRVVSVSDIGDLEVCESIEGIRTNVRVAVEGIEIFAHINTNDRALSDGLTDRLHEVASWYASQSRDSAKRRPHE